MANATIAASPSAASVLPNGPATSIWQSVEPEIINLDEEPQLKAQTMAWKDRRDEFMRKFHANDPQTLKEAWQRFYFLGKMPDGSSPAQHLRKLRLNTPVDKRKQLVVKR